MSTIDPTATLAIALRLAAEGVAMLDAPVSGGPQGARDAALTIMVGGSVGGAGTRQTAVRPAWSDPHPSGRVGCRSDHQGVSL